MESRYRSSRFVQINSEIIRLEDIIRINLEHLSTSGEITVYHQAGSSNLHGTQAIELLLMVKPSALEGSSVRWIRNAWLIHNFFGHPLMQILALLGYRELAFKIHDATVPGVSKLRIQHPLL